CVRAGSGTPESAPRVSQSSSGASCCASASNGRRGHSSRSADSNGNSSTAQRATRRSAARPPSWKGDTVSIEVRPLGVKCNIQCQYCYQNPQRDAGNIPTTFALPRMKAALERAGSNFTIFGGEPLLVPEHV